MANKFLERKWQLWFDAMDVNQDGILSHTDTENEMKAWTRLLHMDAATAAAAEENIATWWKVNVFRSHKGDITKQMFVNDLKKEYLEDKTKFVELITENFNIGFEIVDVDNNGYISENEHFVLFKALGHKDTDTMNALFQSFKPVKGLAKIEDAVDAWVHFVTSDDETAPCPIKDALEKEKK